MLKQKELKKRRPKIKLSPSIIVADFLNLGKELRQLEKGGIDLIHYDVMDGHYVRNFGLNPEILKTVSGHTSVPIDVHLAVSDPDRYINEFVDSGAKMITVQAEACGHIFRTIELIKKNKVKVCIAIAPATPLCALEYLLHQADMFSVMTVNPGFQCQKLIPLMIGKARKLRAMLDENRIEADVQVDGGVCAEVIPELAEAGVNVFVLGSSSLFGPGTNKIQAIKRLRLLAEEAVS